MSGKAPHTLGSYLRQNAGDLIAVGGLGGGSARRVVVSLTVLVSCLLGIVVLPAAASALSPERHYEMVSPVFKGGYGATRIEGVSPDGESVAFYSPGAFAGAPVGVGTSVNTVAYLARHRASGWSSSSLLPPPSLLGGMIAASDVSPTLGLVATNGVLGPNQEVAQQDATQGELLLHATDTPDEAAAWEPDWQVLETFNKALYFDRFQPGEGGSSPDFCHVIGLENRNEPQDTAPGSTFGALLPQVDEAKAHAALYDLTRGCAGETPGLSLVSADNQGQPLEPNCIVQLGSRVGRFNAVAHGGGELFFSVCPANSETDSKGNLLRQLFVRLGDARTLEVSRPLGPCAEVPCPGAASRATATFVGASEDGARVFFTTAAPLTGELGDSSESLYMASIGCPEGEPECTVAARTVTGLTRVSRDPHAGQPSGVQGVVRLAPDGSRVYFVATGDLLGEAEQAALEGEGRPVPHEGADNLYVYDAATGTVAFVADLCSGHELSGAVEDARCPNATATDIKLWTPVRNGGAEAQTAGRDGRYLVFASYGQLTRDDTDAARDVFRYDAVTGALERVSVGEAGHDANGNNSVFDASIMESHAGGPVRFQYEMDNRAVSEDGSRIVFTSAEPLSPAAVNGLPNAYEWHEGQVSLVSTGSAETPVEDVVISPQGNDIFFDTTQGIVPQDIDGAPDVYDARLGAGFPEPPAPRQPCSSDACQGSLTNPAPLLVPGSAVQAPGGNFPPPPASLTVVVAGSKCLKGRKLSHGKCVRSKVKRGKGAARKAATRGRARR
jgi:hypothetical protein